MDNLKAIEMIRMFFEGGDFKKKGETENKIFSGIIKQNISEDEISETINVYFQKYKNNEVIVSEKEELLHEILKEIFNDFKERNVKYEEVKKLWAGFLRRHADGWSTRIAQLKNEGFVV